jgi:hydrogenase nickel incorporation protein HypB
MNNPRILEIRRSVLEKNDLLARDLRARFRLAGVFVVNLVSSPGAGKTALLEATLTQLREAGARPAALVGDLATDNDARRLARSGAPVRQIVTGGNCHLEADLIARHLAAWNIPLAEIDYLFIENVGNLVCPAGYDLGENLRAVLMSVTEGEDKPLKYPVIFHSADIVLLTKIDLAGAADFDRRTALANLQSVCPGIKLLDTSAKTGEGLRGWLDYLVTQREAFLRSIIGGERSVFTG